MSRRPAVGLGVSDFCKLREAGRPYVDRSAEIGDLLCLGNEVSVICRPRRFGKSLLLSTIRAFVEPGEGREALFSDLAIWRDAEARSYFGRHAVLHVSFKDLRGATFELALSAFAVSLQREALRLVGRWPALRAHPSEALGAMLRGAASVAALQSCLAILTSLLWEVSGTKVVLLVDEYDAPLHQAQQRGYYAEMVGLVREMLGSACKENEALAFAVVTGVLRVSREGLWSSLNNARIYSVMDKGLAGICGFTEADVAWLLEETQSQLSLADMRRWYNGYNFSGQILYNPWSVINAVQSDELRAWWVDSGSNEALGALIRAGGPAVQRDLVRWMEGETLPASFGDNILLREDRAEDVVPLLVHSGYLSPVAVSSDGEAWQVTLRVPNRDALMALRSSVYQWLSQMR